MKKIFFSLSLFAYVLLVTAQSGADRDLSSFTEVSVQEGIEVIMTKGSKESAKIETEGIPVEEVLTEISGSSLKIHLEGNNYRNIDVKVYLTYVTLSAVKASSAASITVKDKVEAKGDFEIDCSSAGNIKIMLTAEDVEVDVSSSGDVEMEVTANSLDADISSAGEVNAKGKVKSLEVEASSSGEFDGYDLTSDVAEVRGSSGASIKLTVNDRLDAQASSGASVRYKGAPSNTNIDKSSGGSVNKY